MNDILGILDQVRARTAQLNDSLAAKYGLNPGDAPIGAFNMINQFAIVAMELVSYYATEWAKIPPSDVGADRKQEWAERLITLAKSAYILEMSVIEFSAKQAVIARPSRVALPKGRIYLGAIIDNSSSVGLVVPADSKAWRGLIEVRNVLVHNNGIAEKTITYEIPGGPKIQLIAGAMTQGNLLFFPELMLWSVEGFGRWSDAFLAR